MRKPFSVLSKAVLLPLLGGTLAWAGQAIPAGTQIQIRLLKQLDTGEAKSGQTFSATVAQPAVVGGKTVLARRAKVEGIVTEAVGSGRLRRPASITLELTRGAGVPLHTDPLRIDGKSHLLRDVALIGGGAAAGAAVGGATGGKKGAAVGAAVGAGAGTVTAYLTGKKEIVLPAEMVLTFSVSGNSRTAAAQASRGGREAERESRAVGGRGVEEREAQEATRALVFSVQDQRLIRRYFATNTANLPPGLAKRGGKLPPGHERQLQRNGTLPPGLQKRLEPFPRELNQQLPPLPAGYSRVIIGVRALILDRHNKIVDLMFVRQ